MVNWTTIEEKLAAYSTWVLLVQEGPRQKQKALCGKTTRGTWIQFLKSQKENFQAECQHKKEAQYKKN